VTAEVEVASTPRHENLARVLECGSQAGGHFIISEYLEGTTLRRLLRWLAARGQKLPDAAVARILLGLFAAVEHANHWARTPQVRALVHQPIDTADVFITYAGEVKVLGFKPARARDAALDGEPSAQPGVERAAVDDLLSTQQSPALSAALARIGNRLSTASLIGLWQVARMLRDWQSSELGSDGLAELREVMGSVQPEARAERRRQLEAAVARVLRAREEAEPAADAAPISGFRLSRSSELPVVAPQPARGAAAAPVLIVRAPEAVSHLQRRQLAPPLPADLGPRARSSLLVPCSPSSERAPQGARSAPLPSVRKARRRGVPWASSMLLAAALAAALAVSGKGGERHGADPRGGGSHAGERPEPMSAAPAAVAPVAVRSAPAPSSAPALAVASGSPAASPTSPASPARARDGAHPRPAGAPARTARAPGSDPAQSPLPRSTARFAGNASLARAAAPAAAPGYLTLDTTPWSAVTVGGTSLGQTPLVKVELPPGQHLLELANEELGIATSILVEIASGATTVRRIGLERPLHAARQ
jgi:serine/threonine-protein kinase